VRLESFLEESARRVPDKVALVCGDERRTYAELEADSNRFARGLLGLGVQKGDRVAISLENSPEAVIAFFGVIQAGAAAVLLNTLTKREKFGMLLADSGAKVLVVHAKRLEEIGPSDRTVVVVGPVPAGTAFDRWDDVLAAQDPKAIGAGGSERDLACLLYTSGSTGAPKGVMHTHLSLSTAMRTIAGYLEARESDVVISVLPLSFGYGLTQLLPTFLAGGTLVAERSFAFPQVTLQRMASLRCTGFAMVPTIASILLQNDLSKFDLSSLRYLTNAGAGIPPELLRNLRKRLPWVRIFPMYGQTECIRVTYLPPEEVDRRPASVGRGMANQEMWIVDEEGRRLGPGNTGELVVRGPHLMSGYWNREKATAEKLRPGPTAGERVLFTGDVFRVDADGWYYFVSRKDDIIKTRGEKVSPREVEDVLASLEGVAAAAIVGVPDPLLGQAVKAFVVKKPGADLDERAVLRHCARRLEEFAIPKSVEFLEDLPKTPNSKVDKQALLGREVAT
jgi:long-chain acyl-CoA synthetase